MNLYLRETGTNTGRYLSPSAPGSTDYQGCPAVADYYAEKAFRHTVYKVEGATQTLMGTNVGNTGEWETSAGSYFNDTGTWTPSSTSLNDGGANLRVDVNLYSSENTTGETVTFYSGPLVATGISATQWTFHERGYHQIASDSSWLIVENGTYSYISGITLTGTPTSMRLYPSNVSSQWNATTFSLKGTWSNALGVYRWLGHKQGALESGSQSSQVTSPPYSYLRRYAFSLPLVQAVDFSGDMTGCIGWNEVDAESDMYGKLHIWVSTGTSGTNRGTISSNITTATEVDVNGDTYSYGQDISDSGSSVSASAGDHIILEAGFVITGTETASRLHKMHWGGVGSTDLQDGYYTYDGYPAWIELDIGTGASTLDDDVTGSAHLLSEESDTVQGSAHLLSVESDSVSGGAHLLAVESDTTTGVAHLLAVESDTVDGAAHLLAALSDTVDGSAHLEATGLSDTVTGYAQLTDASGPAWVTAEMANLQDRYVDWDDVGGASGYTVERSVNGGGWVQVYP